MPSPESGSFPKATARRWSFLAGSDFLRAPRTFELTRVQQGFGPEVVVINGFLNESERQVEEWQGALEMLYPNRPWLHLRWEGKNFEDLLGFSREESVPDQAGVAHAAARLPWNHVLKSATAWFAAMHKAEQTGTALADVILRSDRDFVLCGHSLGARVIFYCLRVLVLRRCRRVVRVHLLGGAVDNHAPEWEDLEDATIDGIVNYHSRHDQVLRCLYRIGSAWTSTPIGLHPIPDPGKHVINVDVSDSVAGHSAYKSAFAEYALRLGLT